MSNHIISFLYFLFSPELAYFFLKIVANKSINNLNATVRFILLIIINNFKNTLSFIFDNINSSTFYSNLYLKVFIIGLNEKLILFLINILR